VKNYDPTTGDRLTDCCAAFSTFDQDQNLYCKKCYSPVPAGQGDGSETRAFRMGEKALDVLVASDRDARLGREIDLMGTGARKKFWLLALVESTGGDVDEARKHGCDAIVQGWLAGAPCACCSLTEPEHRRGKADEADHDPCGEFEPAN
jgi:hypothetical protein